MYNSSITTSKSYYYIDTTTGLIKVYPSSINLTISLTYKLVRHLESMCTLVALIFSLMTFRSMEIQVPMSQSVDYVDTLLYTRSLAL